MVQDFTTTSFPEPVLTLEKNSSFSFFSFCFFVLQWLSSSSWLQRYAKAANFNRKPRRSKYHINELFQTIAFRNNTLKKYHDSINNERGGSQYENGENHVASKTKQQNPRSSWVSCGLLDVVR